MLQDRPPALIKFGTVRPYIFHDQARSGEIQGSCSAKKTPDRSHEPECIFKMSRRKLDTDRSDKTYNRLLTPMPHIPLECQTRFLTCSASRSQRGRSRAAKTAGAAKMQHASPQRASAAKSSNTKYLTGRDVTIQRTGRR